MGWRTETSDAYIFRMQIEDYEQFPLGSPQREVLGDAVYIEPSTTIR
jgi:hypothetical protein